LGKPEESMEAAKASRIVYSRIESSFASLKKLNILFLKKGGAGDGWWAKRRGSAVPE